MIIYAGKAILCEQDRAELRLTWFELASRDTARRMALAFVRECYPEATDIQLLAVPDNDSACVAVFKPHRGYPGFRLSRYHTP